MWALLDHIYFTDGSNVAHKYTAETIIHFTCEQCKMWWSYATEHWIPKVQTCPHCGQKAQIEENK
jgi:hypothetical protein